MYETFFLLDTQTTNYKFFYTIQILTYCIYTIIPIRQPNKRRLG
jgi:hypothetical protein